MRTFPNMTGRRAGDYPNRGASRHTATRSAAAVARLAASIAANWLSRGQTLGLCAVSGALALPAILAPSATAARVPTPGARYGLSVLPTLQCPRSFACPKGRFDLGEASGINNEGWIVGATNVPGSTSISNATEHATVWRHGHITDLGTLGGPNSAIGFVARPSDTGRLAGSSQIGTVDPLGEGWGLNFGCDTVNDPCAGSQYEDRGFVWKTGRMRALPTLGGNNAIPEGGENARGQIVGFAENRVRAHNCTAPQVLEWKPVIWGPEYGQIHALRLYHGDNVGAATAINDKGQVVGGSGSCAPPAFSAITHPLLWQPDRSPVYLGGLGGLQDNLPTAINNRSQVVGWSDLPGDATTHAFLWQHGNMTDLGTLSGDSSSYAYAINSRGQVVGQSCDQQGNCRAFLWQHGTMTDLNQITHKPAGFDLLNAEGINDHGEIVGSVYDTARGTSYAFAAKPSATSPTGSQPSTHSGQLTTRSTATVRAQLRTHLGFGLLAVR